MFQPAGHKSLLAALFLALEVLSSPVSTTATDADGDTVLNRLNRRSTPCDNGGTPILYQSYFQDKCPPVNPLDPKTGNCIGGFVNADKQFNCNVYCDVKNTFYYGQEVIQTEIFHGPGTSAVSQANAKAYTSKWDFNGNVKLKDIFTLGVTYGWSNTETKTDTTTRTINLQSGQCAYFTFLPILHDSCGTLTTGDEAGGPPPPLPPIWNPFPPSPPEPLHCVNVQSQGNFCGTQAYRSGDGTKVLGDTVLVFVNCDTHERINNPSLPQDPAYWNHPEVQQPQAVINALFNDCTVTPECAQPNPDGTINSQCKCTCNGQSTGWADPGCRPQIPGNFPPKTSDPPQPPNPHGPPPNGPKPPK